MRSYAIIGTGAVGGYYGARLHQSGCEVHFLAHRDAAHIRDHGLRVEMPDRQLIIGRPRVYGRPGDMPPCDVAVVALKSTRNHLLAVLLPPALKPDGFVLLLQNGLGIEDDVAKLVGQDRVMGGLCFISANKVGPGLIRFLDYGEILLGDYAADGRPMGVTPRMRQVAGDFEAAQVPVRLSEDLLSARWHKLVWNIPYNALSVIRGATTDRLMATPEDRAHVERIMREVVAAARGCGRVIEDAFVRKMLDDTLRMQPYKTSMLLDWEAGRPLEVDAIYGRPILAAHAAGVRVPMIEELERQLRALEARRHGAGAAASGTVPGTAS